MTLTMQECLICEPRSDCRVRVDVVVHQNFAQRFSTCHRQTSGYLKAQYSSRLALISGNSINTTQTLENFVGLFQLRDVKRQEWME